MPRLAWVDRLDPKGHILGDLDCLVAREVGLGEGDVCLVLDLVVAGGLWNEGLIDCWSTYSGGWLPPPR